MKMSNEERQQKLAEVREKIRLAKKRVKQAELEEKMLLDRQEIRRCQKK
jgi:hypothetical protein